LGQYKELYEDSHWGDDEDKLIDFEDLDAEFGNKPVDILDKYDDPKLAEKASLLTQAETSLPQEAINASMVGVLLYGLIINAITTLFFSDVLGVVSSVILGVVYLVVVALSMAVAYENDKWHISFLAYNAIVLPLGFLLSNILYLLTEWGNGVMPTACIMSIGACLGMGLFGVIGPYLWNGLAWILCGSLLGGSAAIFGMWYFGFGFNIWGILIGLLFLWKIGKVFWYRQDDEYLDDAVDAGVEVYVEIFILLYWLVRIFGGINTSGADVSGRSGRGSRSSDSSSNGRHSSRTRSTGSGSHMSGRGVKGSGSHSGRRVRTGKGKHFQK